MSYQGKSVIVTGASVGIGRETAILLAEHGAKVVVNYASSRTQAEDTVAAIADAGGTAVPCQGDVSKAEDADRVVATAVKEFGRLDILINNAGITAFIPFQDLDAADAETWLRLYSTNVVGAFFCARAAAREMRKTGGGVIVNIASISGQRAAGSSIPYCSSKAALLHMTRCLALTLSPEIRVCSVSPGVIEDTRWNVGRVNYDAAKAHDVAVEESLLREVGKARDIAEAIRYIASDEAGFCTGVDLLVDGGRGYKV